MSILAWKSSFVIDLYSNSVNHKLILIRGAETMPSYLPIDEHLPHPTVATADNT